ncbi:MAG: OmpH family outer membrane protein [Muribaculaceae bacterium]|nr:OmpH family outer membrane protein [Muribaculaceae bacterium]
MKKFAILANLALLLFVSSCSNEKAVESAKQAKTYPTTTNIRYIDMDSITAHYNLAIDYKEWLVKETDRLEKKIKGLYSAAQKFENECQVKAKNNGYLTEASYNADLQKYQNMVVNAQKQEQTIRRRATEEDAEWQKQLQDSILSFIEDYNKEHKYDAILFKAAGVYFNPALEITNEVIEGLNARYNKVATPKEEKAEENKSEAKK